MPQTSDTRVQNFSPIISPRQLFSEQPASEAIETHVLRQRQAIEDILLGKDKRLLAIVGPCSIHDPDAALDYAHKLRDLSIKVADKFLLIMRVYFEKPRTKLGWKGLILDPHLDNSNDIPNGLRLARKVLRQVNELGLPAAIEALDPIVLQYIDDLVCWAAIGARTTESQTHREMASGLSMPVGFKNGTDGSVDTAVNAMVSAGSSHSFIGLDRDGRASLVKTSGNPMGHIILRGGKAGPNYHRESLEETIKLLKSANLPQRIVIDCSHANSNKDYRKQSCVLEEVIQHRKRGFDSVMGFMLESNLIEGRQEIPNDLNLLVYGQSVTDACIGWQQTEQLILSTAKQVTL